MQNNRKAAFSTISHSVLLSVTQELPPNRVQRFVDMIAAPPPYYGSHNCTYLEEVFFSLHWWWRRLILHPLQLLDDIPCWQQWLEGDVWEHSSTTRAKWIKSDRGTVSTSKVEITSEDIWNSFPAPCLNSLNLIVNDVLACSGDGKSSDDARRNWSQTYVDFTFTSQELEDGDIRYLDLILSTEVWLFWRVAKCSLKPLILAKSCHSKAVKHGNISPLASSVIRKDVFP